MGSANFEKVIRGRVARGAELLDSIRPGWRKEVDLDRLDLSSCHECVLGQLFGGYTYGEDELQRAVPDFYYDHSVSIGAFYGFSKTIREDFRWEDLNKAWREEIAKQ